MPPALAQVEGFAKEFAAFLAHRREIRFPMTLRAQEIMLTKLAARPGDALAALRMGIEHGWRGLEWDWYDRRVNARPSATVGLRPGENPLIWEGGAA